MHHAFGLTIVCVRSYKHVKVKVFPSLSALQILGYFNVHTGLRNKWNITWINVIHNHEQVLSRSL